MRAFAGSALIIIAASLIASCKFSPPLSEDDYTTRKFDLPPILHVDSSKTISIAAGSDGWLCIPVNPGECYTLESPSGSPAAKLSAYHADKATPYFTDLDASAKPIFQATVKEFAHIKITITGGTAASYTLNCLFSTLLSVGSWRDDSLESGKARWYSLPVTAGTWYDFSMNNATAGDGTKTAHIEAHILRADRSTYYLYSISEAYAIPETFVAKATETLYIRIENNYSVSGTYAIRIQPSPLPTPLTSGQWRDDTIVAGHRLWYTYPVIQGGSYDFYQNSLGIGDGTKTANVGAAFYHADRSASYYEEYGPGNGLVTFIAATTENILIEVAAVSSGTFALRIRPTPDPPVLSPGVWLSDTIMANQTLWYSFPVIAETLYDFSMNTARAGDGSKTADISVSIYNADKSKSIRSEIYSAYAYPETFVAPSTENILISINADSGGTFAIRIEPTPTPAALVLGEWKNDTIGHGQNKWYSLSVTEGVSYDFFMNGSVFGDRSKTADTQAYIYRADKITPYLLYIEQAFDSPVTFVAAATEDVFIRIITSSPGGGTYSIMMQTSPGL